MAGSEMSFDAPLHDDSGSTLLSVVPSGSESAEDQIAKKELQDALISALSEFEAILSEKEKKIFKGRIVTDDKLTLQDLSDQLSLSKERVRQIENKLRDKLKTFVSKKLGSELDDWVGQ
jgi:RNA polymerase sigma-32 factor